VNDAAPLLEYANPLADQPIGSRALCERHEDGGVTFTLPPEGLTRALVGLILLGLPLAALLVLMLAIVVDSTEPSAALCGLPFVIPFALLWAALLRASRRPTIISVRGGTVTLNSGAAVFWAARSWRAGDVIGVRVSLSGLSTRMRLLGDLKLQMRRGRRTVHLILGGDKPELEWIARGIRAALHLPAV
jgi:hypothetical protein